MCWIGRNFHEATKTPQNKNELEGVRLQKISCVCDPLLAPSIERRNKFENKRQSIKLTNLGILVFDINFISVFHRITHS